MSGRSDSDESSKHALRVTHYTEPSIRRCITIHLELEPLLIGTEQDMSLAETTPLNIRPLSTYFSEAAGSSEATDSSEARASWSMPASDSPTGPPTRALDSTSGQGKSLLSSLGGQLEVYKLRTRHLEEQNMRLTAEVASLTVRNDIVSNASSV